MGCCQDKPIKQYSGNFRNVVTNHVWVGAETIEIPAASDRFSVLISCSVGDSQLPNRIQGFPIDVHGLHVRFGDDDYGDYGFHIEDRMPPWLITFNDIGPLITQRIRIKGWYASYRVCILETFYNPQSI